jgi:hypothetical protein
MKKVLVVVPVEICVVLVLRSVVNDDVDIINQPVEATVDIVDGTVIKTVVEANIEVVVKTAVEKIVVGVDALSKVNVTTFDAPVDILVSFVIVVVVVAEDIMVVGMLVSVVVVSPDDEALFVVVITVDEVLTVEAVDATGVVD